MNTQKKKPPPVGGFDARRRIGQHRSTSLIGNPAQAGSRCVFHRPRTYCRHIGAAILAGFDQLD
jgi:hypothetical protein